MERTRNEFVDFVANDSDIMGKSVAGGQQREIILFVSDNIFGFDSSHKQALTNINTNQFEIE